MNSYIRGCLKIAEERRQHDARYRKARNVLGTPRPCKHCGTLTRCYKGRGLCWKCYGNTAVRAAYSTCDGREPKPLRGGLKLPAQPTNAVLGSKQKVDVMEARAARGESVFHPDDLTVVDNRDDGVDHTVFESYAAHPVMDR